MTTKPIYLTKSLAAHYRAVITAYWDHPLASYSGAQELAAAIHKRMQDGTLSLADVRGVNEGS